MELDADLAHQAAAAKYVSVIGEKLTNTNEYFQNLIRSQTPFRVKYFSAGLRLAIDVPEHHQDLVKPCSSSTCNYIYENHYSIPVVSVDLSGERYNRSLRRSWAFYS
jgi:hypothetical protein